MPLRRLATSFRNALHGLNYTWRHEQNFRIEVILGILVMLLGWWLRVTASDWLWLVSAIGLVLILELANTAAEKVLDVVKPQLFVSVAVVKDVMAAAVILGSFLAAAVGLIILLPRLVEVVLG